MGSLVLVVVAGGSSDPPATHTKAILTSSEGCLVSLSWISAAHLWYPWLGEVRSMQMRRAAPGSYYSSGLSVGAS